MRFLQSIGCATPIAILFYGLVGVLLLTQFGDPALNYVRSIGWEQVPGTVISSEVEDAWDTTGDRYTGQIIYTYEVDGVTYEGTQIDLRGQVYTGNRADAEQLLAPYPVGASVMPYVDLSDPSRALLDRDLPGATWGIIGTGAVLLLLSLGLGIGFLVSRRQRQK